jgi:hypothetical protein
MVCEFSGKHAHHAPRMEYRTQFLAIEPIYIYLQSPSACREEQNCFLFEYFRGFNIGFSSIVLTFYEHVVILRVHD